MTLCHRRRVEAILYEERERKRERGWREKEKKDEKEIDYQNKKKKKRNQEIKFSNEEDINNLNSPNLGKLKKKKNRENTAYIYYKVKKRFIKKKTTFLGVHAMTVFGHVLSKQGVGERVGGKWGNRRRKGERVGREGGIGHVV